MRGITVRENKEETYVMQYKCCNCGKLFTKRLPKGTIGRKNGGECPTCGVKDNSDGGVHQVMGHTAEKVETNVSPIIV